MSRRIAFAAAALVALTAGPAWAQLPPHVHGTGELKIAVEDGTLYMIWKSPLANLVGFEHAPKTAEERAATRRMEDQARDFARLFRTPAAAGCKLAEVALHSTGEETATEARGRGHDVKHADEKTHAHEKDHSQEKERAEKHDHDKKHAEKPAAEKGHAHSETHAELSAEYKVACRDIKALDHIEVMVFDAFPGTETLKAEIITAAGQSAVTLAPKSRRVGLK